MVAAPAMACGYTPCAAPQLYVAPAPAYDSGCNPCGGWAHERLADPEQQYYYVNQGPTFTGPGNWAPRPAYEEGSVYSHRPYRTYRPWRPRVSYRYGYAPRHAYAPRYAPAPYRYGRPLRRYY
jgi:hypothetical protein